ncbi:MAG: hypothetical protein QF492_09170 [Candidatus Krumholzibacteria bacterium]|jgi:hypothetical protein|nr:hypothetical protein [Candidatus Krumholzibacteria bacterium]MDP6670054.1 hypothetical protein [Candidatus Krumholzibacteria bacterium]MDP6797093.1 hypothetical protein [Candidatus Krumholzibacteria bacterium]MDP7020732.1 hypothetical protein [Candidatus Krumholzibacteria bacterium]
MRKCILILFLLLATSSLAQEDYYLVNSPLAALPAHGDYQFTARILDGGTVLARTEIGIQDRFSLGLSWGMLGLLGTGKVRTYSETGLMLRYRLVEEIELPSMLVGFDNQGQGNWSDEYQRYDRKSKGFFFVMTRHWFGPFGTDFSTSGGLNYSLEGNDESGFDLFAGLEWVLEPRFSLILDWSAGLNDRYLDERFGEGNGWLDLALAWKIADRIQFKVLVCDLFENSLDPVTGETPGAERQLLVSFGSHF